MKEKILNIIEEEIQKLRSEISDELNKMNNTGGNESTSHYRSSLIAVSQVNKLREIKHKINNLKEN